MVIMAVGNNRFTGGAFEVAPKADLTDGLLDLAVLASANASDLKDIADELVNSGIKAILNFAPYKILVDKYIKLKNIDLATELEGLSYFLSR